MKAANGQLLFTPKNIDILGGHVEALVSKWEMTKSLAGIKGELMVNIVSGLCFNLTLCSSSIE